MEQKRVYDVEMSTLLGRRRGSLELSICNGLLSGILQLMKAENPVCGTLGENQQCTLSGNIRTRMGNYPFEGEGRMDLEKIDLMLRCAGLNLPLHGIRKEA